MLKNSLNDEKDLIEIRREELVRLLETHNFSKIFILSNTPGRLVRSLEFTDTTTLSSSPSRDACLLIVTVSTESVLTI